MNYARSENGLIHLVSAINGEFTLCGDAFNIDALQDGAEDGLAWTEVRSGPVTCPRCADQIRACRGVRVANKTGERICEPSAGSKYAPLDGSARSGEIT